MNNEFTTKVNINEIISFIWKIVNKLNGSYNPENKIIGSWNHQRIVNYIKEMLLTIYKIRKEKFK